MYFCSLDRHIMKFLRAFIVLFVFLAGLIIANYVYVDYYAQKNVYHQADKIPFSRVGMILGTSKYTRDKKPNLFYNFRLDAAEKLFKAGKIRFLLISGDNSSRYYNEPVTIKKDLIKRGIPGEKIFLDYAGFRTYDSMLRAHEVFGLDTLTVISQDFHVRRAIYIGKHKGMHINGFAAKTPGGISRIKIIAREMLARILVQWDILTHRKPKFLGDKIKIE